MLPAQRNKVDISKLSEQEQLLFKKYGKLPTHKNTLLKMQKDRKYFDSGDYALSKAGVSSDSVGTAIPNPGNIPHASSSSNNATLQSSVNKEKDASDAPSNSIDAKDQEGDAAIDSADSTL